MQVSVESTSALERRMTIGVPVERIETEVNKRLQQTASRAKIPGFRPGKVPAAHVRRLYGKALMSEVVQQSVNESTQKVLTDNNLRPAGEAG